MPPHRLSELVSLQLEDADLSDLVRVVGQVTGKRFLIASPRLAKIKASVYAPEKVTAQEAYQAMLAVLTANGLTVVPAGGFFRIVESENIARQVLPLDQSDKGSPEERYVTRIHRMKHLSAEEVATGVLSKLSTKDASIVPYAAGNLLIMTETGANLRRLMEILDAIDQPGSDAKLYFQPLSHISSQAAEKLLTDLLDLKKKDAQLPGAALYVGRLVAVERPNALIIVASDSSYQRIFELLRRIDILEPNETQVHVVALQHADAKKIVGPLADAIGTQAPAQAPRSGASAATAPTSTGTVGQLLEGPAHISADETTNSLIVTAGPRDFANIKEVIAALDKAKRQVFIEAVILDISDSSGLDLGVAWHGGNVDSSKKGNTTEFGGFRSATSALPPSTSDLQGLALGVTGPSIPFNTGITGITTIPSIGAFLTAAATTKGADILSTPSITASDNMPAEIKVQLNASLQPHAPQPAQYLTGSTGSLPQTSSGVTSNYKAIGPRVKITPHLNDSDEVRLDIEEVISDIASEPGASDTYGTVSFIERAATTTMTVKDGNTAVIGGLVRNIHAPQRVQGAHPGRHSAAGRALPHAQRHDGEEQSGAHPHAVHHSWRGGHAPHCRAQEGRATGAHRSRCRLQ
jgi:general secretion pathway protein D